MLRTDLILASVLSLLAGAALASNWQPRDQTDIKSALREVLGTPDIDVISKSGRIFVAMHPGNLLCPADDLDCAKTSAVAGAELCGGAGFRSGRIIQTSPALEAHKPPPRLQFGGYLCFN